MKLSIFNLCLQIKIEFLITLFIKFVCRLRIKIDPNNFTVLVLPFLINLQTPLVLKDPCIKFNLIINSWLMLFDLIEQIMKIVGFILLQKDGKGVFLFHY